MQRFVIVESSSPAAVHAAVEELSGDRAVVVSGWVLPLHSHDRTVLCVGRVTGVDDAADAVLAAVGGANLVVEASAGREVVDQLCDDLRRLGDLDHRVTATPRPELSVDERRLLEQLLAGASLGQAAHRLHLSRRTADRRLASARSALGTSSTAEALRRALDIGIRPGG